MTDDNTTPPADRPGGAPGGFSGSIAPIAIEDEQKRSYLDYSMSVIFSRALPDVRDGLKPVHRRILFSMNEQGHTPDRSYVKSARVVGDVMGKYHPHGDQAIYDTLVRMAQPFSMNLLLIDGQGNFGSVDNDPPAAMREFAPQTKAAVAILADLDKDTVDFKDTTTARRASRWSCRRGSPTCSSTAPPASLSAWPPTSRRTIWARSLTPAWPTSTTRR